MKYKLSGGGGTFDHFHKGHQAFLLSMLELSDHILLGITSDIYVRRNKSGTSAVQPYSERKQAVQAFLKQHNAIDRVTIAPIDTLFYPSKWEALPIEAIIVTNDTVRGAQIINEDREKKKIPVLNIVIADVASGKLGNKISSTEIRAGKIDTNGNPYFDDSLPGKDLLLPKNERHRLQQPFSQLLSDMAILKEEDPSQLVTVGDAISRNCNERGLQQKLSVIDFTVQRNKIYEKVEDIGFSGQEMLLHADNPPGHITASLVAAITSAINYVSQEQRIVLIVNGEEDLAVIPLVLMLPLSYVILYGQPGEGVVRLEVTLETKNRARELLKKFTEV